MKKIKFCLATCLLIITSAASAQFANSGTSTNAGVSTHTRTVNTNGWQRVFVSYNPVKIISDVSGTDDLSGTGITFGYAKGFNIAKELPLFIETGINAMYSFYTYDKDGKMTFNDYKGETKTSSLTVNIPVNLAYKFTLSNENIFIIPFIGINLKGNIIGKEKNKLTEDIKDEDYSESEFWKDWEEEHEKKQERNMFDKKEAGSKDAQWKRFQMGWQIGVGLNYNQLYVGVSYGKDFTELYKKAKVSTTSITLGYSF